MGLWIRVRVCAQPRVRSPLSDELRVERVDFFRRFAPLQHQKRGCGVPRVYVRVGMHACACMRVCVPVVGVQERGGRRRRREEQKGKKRGLSAPASRSC